MLTRNKPLLISKAGLDNYVVIQTRYYEIGYYLQTARNKNTCEDALLIHPMNEQLLLAVCDGVGSTERSYRAAIKVLKQLSELSQVTNGDVLLELIENSNRTLCSMSGQPQTTLTLVLIDANKYSCMQVGDSGVFHCGNHGKLKYKSNLHSPVGFAVANEKISEEDSLKHPELHIVDNVLGSEDYYVEKSPKKRIAKYDTLFLTSDGLLDNFMSNELIDIIRKRSITTVCQELVASCKDYKHPFTHEAYHKIDDIGFIVVKGLARSD